MVFASKYKVNINRHDYWGCISSILAGLWEAKASVLPENIQEMFTL